MTSLDRCRLRVITALAVSLTLSVVAPAPARAAEPIPALPALPDAPTAVVNGNGQIVVVVPSTPGTTITILPPLPAPTPLAPPVVVSPNVEPPATPRPATETALVHLNGRTQLTLDAVFSGETTWKPVCGAPCDAPMPLDALYRVTGPEVQPSKAFRLAALAGERVVIDVDPTTDAAHAGGEALMIGGGIGIVGGAAILYVDLLASAACVDGGSGCGPSSGVLWTGIGALAVGTAALIAGIVVIQPTSVEQSTGPRGVAFGKTAKNDGWLRAPVWRDPSAEEASLPKAMSVPLFTTSF